MIEYSGHHNLIDFSDLATMRKVFPDKPFYKNIVSFLSEWFDPTVPDIKVHTSGSTGAPKEMQFSRKTLARSAELTADTFMLGKGARVLLGLPVHFIAGKMMLVRAIVNDWQLAITSPASNPFHNAPQGHFAFVPLTPMQMDHVLKNSPSRIDDVSIFLLGGASAPSGLAERLKKLEPEVYLGYGMTETLTHVAIKRMNGPDPDDCYRALKGVRFSLTENNCLIINADHLPNTVATNDVVELLDSHRFKWLGRFDNMINSGSIKIHPEMVEAILKEQIGKEAVVTSVPDAQLGEKVILILEQSQSPGSLANDFTVKEINDVIRDTLGKHYIPKSVYLIDKFARTKSGKPIRHRIKMEAVDKGIVL